MKKALPLAALLLLSLSACTTAPASVLEREARVKQQTAEFESQTSSWQQEQESAANNDGYFEGGTHVVLEELRDAFFARPLTKSNDADSVEESGSMVGKFFVDVGPDGIAQGLTIGFMSEADFKDYSLTLACLGIGSGRVTVSSAGSLVDAFDLECTVPESPKTSAIRLKKTADQIDVDYVPESKTRGQIEYRLDY